MNEYCPSLAESLEEEIESLRSELDFLRKEYGESLAHSSWCESAYVKLKVENNRLRAENEELSSRLETASVASDSIWKERYGQIERDNELLRAMVCSCSDSCVDFESLVETVHEHYNADD